VPTEREAYAGDVAIIGRGPELTAAATFLQGPGSGLRALLFEGEAGIGKTTLWLETIGRASALGIRALPCRPAQMETGLALSAIADLVDTAPADAVASLPDPQRHALEITLLREDPGPSQLEPRAVSTAFRSLLAALTETGPVLVAIDDVQWLDPASANAIRYALRRLAGTSLRCLFTRRVTEPDPVHVEAIAPHEAVIQVRVGPLTLASLHQLLRDRLQHQFSRPALARIHQMCAGNPLHALEVARAMSLGTRRPLQGTAAPDDLRQLITSRVGRLPPDTRDALLACAALSRPTTMQVDECALLPAEVDELVRIDDSGLVRFQHPLYASAIYESAPRSQRRSTHLRLAQLVTDIEERARHLALAAAGPDGEIAGALEQAAAHARARGAWESAGDLLELAARLTPIDLASDGTRRTLAAAEHHVHAGDRPRARTLLEALLAEPLTPSARGRALYLLGEVACADEHYLEARRLFVTALELADDPRSAHACEMGLSFVDSNLSDFPAAAVHTYRALEYAEASGDGPIIAEALSACLALDFLCGRGFDSAKVERSLALEDTNRAVAPWRRPSGSVGQVMLWLGRHAEARERLLRVCTDARQRGDESDQAYTLVWLSWLETRGGDFAAAERFAREGVEEAALSGNQSTQGFLRAQQAYIHAHRGEIEQTRQACADAESAAEHFGNRLPAIWVAASRALLELSLGNPAAAWQACEPLTTLLEQYGIGEPVTVFFLPDAVESLIFRGELQRAHDLIDALERRGRELDRASALATGARCRGLLLATRGDVDGARSAFEQALVEHARVPMPFEQARTLLAKGIVERRARQRARAKASLQQALSEFQRMGAALFAARAHEEMRRLGLRRSNHELTECERRVAELAATGRTNRQIAAALFMSAKTVEANLARAYGKLGIASRAELGAVMASEGQR